MDNNRGTKAEESHIEIWKAERRLKEVGATLIKGSLQTSSEHSALKGIQWSISLHNLLWRYLLKMNLSKAGHQGFRKAELQKLMLETTTALHCNVTG